MVWYFLFFKLSASKCFQSNKPQVSWSHQNTILRLEINTILAKIMCMTIKHYRGSLINDDFSVVPDILSSCSLTRIISTRPSTHLWIFLYFMDISAHWPFTFMAGVEGVHISGAAQLFKTLPSFRIPQDSWSCSQNVCGYHHSASDRNLRSRCWWPRHNLANQLPAPQRGGLGATVCVGFVVHIVALRKVSLKVVEFSLLFATPPAFHIHAFIVRGLGSRLEFQDT